MYRTTNPPLNNFPVLMKSVEPCKIAVMFRRKTHHRPGVGNKAVRASVAVFRLSWKRRERSAVKITERTHEKGTTTSLSRAEGDHSAAASTGEGTDFGPVRGVWTATDGILPLAERVL